MLGVVRPTILRTVYAAFDAVTGTKPARWLRTLLIVSALAGLCNTAALGQWSGRATASYGRGLGSIALSQGNLSLGRSILREHASAGRTSVPPPAALTPTQIEAALSFTPDPKLSENIRIAMIDTVSKGDPTSRPIWEEAFADNAILRDFASLMSAHGYSSLNFSDDIATLLWVSWEIVTGSKASAAQIQGVHEQARGIVLGNPQLRATPNPVRQAMAEAIAYQVVIFSAANTEVLRTGDQAQLRQLRENVTTAARPFGLDVSRMRLTNKGFKKS
jgi:hypothetical protein